MVTWWKNHGLNVARKNVAEGRMPMQDKMKSLITNIKLDAATFHGETVDPTYINFFFGKNGAGKSTVAYA